MSTGVDQSTTMLNVQSKILMWCGAKILIVSNDMLIEKSKSRSDLSTLGQWVHVDWKSASVGQNATMSYVQSKINYYF